MLILTFCPGSTATLLLFRKYSSAKIQPDFRNKKLEGKKMKNLRQWASLCVCVHVCRTL